ncbi:hypothetical protein L596_005697 [Steinernema carpocapsae]|uniref:Uncharacterized protein n=1 Tax=Steinernema carpocapsae TaxID=34508 RepID=A0A4U8V139_STECR|nr:hypothetical protein L596_005697 [Steinernema carpocapsae]
MDGQANKSTRRRSLWGPGEFLLHASHIFFSALFDCRPHQNRTLPTSQQRCRRWEHNLSQSSRRCRRPTTALTRIFLLFFFLLTTSLQRRRQRRSRLECDEGVGD